MNRNCRDKYNQQNTRDKRISGAEDTVEEINIGHRKHSIQHILNTKHLGKPGHHEKTKLKNNRGRRRRRIPVQRHRKHIQQNYRRKLSQSKEEYPYESTRSLQNIKYCIKKINIIIKTQNIQKKERISRTAKEKCQVTF